jgi:mono/diheme cytochrome c family protein
MKRTVAILSVGAFILSAAYATVGAQDKVSAGVYTDEQAALGEGVYKEQCAACHGDNLEGSGPMPPLAGLDFLTNWKGKTLGDLYEKTQTTMPATAPGTLTSEQTADILAYMLKASKYPAGTTALVGKMEALLPISIDAQ